MNSQDKEPLGRAPRQMSTVFFPYVDLDEAITLARTVFTKAGHQCAVDQAAAWLGHETSDSGAFRNKVYAARIFGLIELARGTITLTTLGMEIVEPSRESIARSNAFLSVPLYRTVYEKYRGKMLPPDAALENELVNVGVAPKQKDRARQVFQRSASQAGFFNAGSDRLVQPAVALSSPMSSEVQNKYDENKIQDATVGKQNSPHPLIAALMLTIPAENEPWPIQRRKKWLLTAENIFNLIFQDDDGKGNGIN